MTVGPQQFWLGTSRTGQQVRFWPGQCHKLQGVRLAGPQALPPASMVIQRKVSSRGGIQVARQRIQVGFSHAVQTVTIEPGDTTLRIIDQHGELITTIPRTAPWPDHQVQGLSNARRPARVRSLQRPGGRPPRGGHS